MSRAIVTNSHDPVNPFNKFKSKVKAYAQAVKADSFQCYNDGDQYVAYVKSDRPVTIYGRPGSLQIQVRFANDIHATHMVII